MLGCWVLGHLLAESGDTVVPGGGAYSVVLDQVFFLRVVKADDYPVFSAIFADF